MESIQVFVQDIKEDLFSSFHPYTFVQPSAYDTAWLAMIPDPQHPDRPLFRECVEWIIQNQCDESFWGEPGQSPTIESLSAALACMAALKRWNVGSTNIETGLAFFQANAEKLVEGLNGHCPRWFAIVFPAMVELAQSEALDVFPNGKGQAVANIYKEKQRILDMETRANRASDAPLLSYMEALPSAYISHDEIIQHQSRDGSLFQSPSATAYAFMVTGDRECKNYLESIVQNCRQGVPPVFPVDEELVKLCLVNRLEMMGLAEHFSREIERILWGVYRNWREQELEDTRISITPQKTFKDSLAFRLLRTNGYRVSPKRICWYLQHPDILNYVEENCQEFLSAMLNVHRATDFMFKGESELEQARMFSRKILEKGIGMICAEHGAYISNFKKEIERELTLPWFARLDHLEHRTTIEGTKTEYLWLEKVSLHRLSFFNNTLLLQLAQANYAYRQSLFMNELKEVTRWARDFGLCDMGFGREKTSYCYFAVAATAYSPSFSNVRTVAAKCAILITVADDFFDMEGSMHELNQLTSAVLRWDAEGLSGPGKTVFSALENLNNDIALQIMDQHGYDAADELRHIWYETFMAWLKEAEWSRKQGAPPIAEYVETGMTSIAAHMVLLPAFYSASARLPKCLLRDTLSEDITRQLMLITRLLNDIQSYQKEMEDGKLNMVLLYMKENPEANIEDSINYIRDLIDMKKKELLQLVLVDGLSNMPRTLKQLHLQCLKVFQMFFNSSNGYDSPTAMLADINHTIYDPLVGTSEVMLQQESMLQKYIPSKKTATVETQIARSFRDDGDRVSTLPQMKMMGGVYSPKRSQFKSLNYTGFRELGNGHMPRAICISRNYQLRSNARVVSIPSNVSKSLVWW